MCDVTSYVYMPMLEELNYIPTERYAFGAEIRKHLENIARTYNLVDDALFQTGVEESRWQEDISRWLIRTDHGDQIKARYLIMGPGILNLMKLPAIPGMELFEGHSFHAGRWDYEYTGGPDADSRKAALGGGPEGNLPKLADKVVGVAGTGPSAVQFIPHVAESAKHLYVFQRTPTAVGVRDNRATGQDFSENLHPGWQQEWIDNFYAVVTGRAVERDLIDDGWTHHVGPLANSPSARAAEEVDFAVMEQHRSRIDEIVSDKRAAEILKPYYRYMCKRPSFHDEYLQSFNLPNVTLIDCPTGIERVTESGVVVNGNHIDLDCLIYSTGFEAEATALERRVGHPIIGRGGVSLSEKWQGGVSTLHGIVTRGFPNLFFVPGGRQAGGTGFNFTHSVLECAEHVAATVAELERRGIRGFDVNSEAEEDWAQKVLDSHSEGRTTAFTDTDFMASCTPSRFNFEGHPPQTINRRYANYGGGSGDLFAYRSVLAQWREKGDFEGWELYGDEPKVNSTTGQRP